MAGLTVIAEDARVSKSAAEDIMDAIKNRLLNGEAVVIPGFGTFVPELVPERPGYQTPIMKTRGEEPRDLPASLRFKFRSLRNRALRAEQDQAAARLMAAGQTTVAHGGSLVAEG